MSSIKVFEFSKEYSAPVVYASSSAIYGNLPLGHDEIKKFSILSPYAQDKLSIENYAELSFEIFKMSSVGLRLFNVYGPGQTATSPYSAVIPIFIYRMLKNLPITINGGFQTRDFIFVGDVIEVMKESMRKIQKKEICKNFNVGTGRSVKIDTLFNLIRKIIGTNPKLIRKKLEKYDPKKSSGTFKKLNNFLNFKKKKFDWLSHDELMDLGREKFEQRELREKHPALKEAWEKYLVLLMTFLMYQELLLRQQLMILLETKF